MRPFQSLHLSRGLSREERRNINCQSSKHILWGSWSKNLFLASRKVTKPKWSTFSRVAKSQKAIETFIHDNQSVICSFLTHRRSKASGAFLRRFGLIWYLKENNTKCSKEGKKKTNKKQTTKHPPTRLHQPYNKNPTFSKLWYPWKNLWYSKQVNIHYPWRTLNFINLTEVIFLSS